MRPSFQSIWFQIAGTSGARFYSLFINLVIMILTARVLGPEGRGIIVAVAAWVGVYANFASLSLGQVVQAFIPPNSAQRWLPATFSNVLVLSLALTGLAGIAAGGQYALFPESFGGLPPLYLAVGYLMLPLLIWEINSSLLMAASERLYLYNKAQIVGRSVALMLVLLGLTLPGRDAAILVVLAAQTLGQAIVSLWSFLSLWTASDKKISVDAGELKKLLKGALQLHFNTIGAFVIFQTSILMLNFRSQEEVGIYQLSIQLMNIMLLIPQGASIVFFSRMATLGPDGFWPQQRRLMFYLLLLMCLLAASAYFLVPIVIPILVGEAFRESTVVFRRLLPIVLGISAALLMSNQWVGRRLFLLTSGLTLLTASINIILGYYLIGRYGIPGAIISDTISLLGIVFVAQIIFAGWCELRHRSSKGSAVDETDQLPQVSPKR